MTDEESVTEPFVRHDRFHGQDGSFTLDSVVFDTAVTIGSREPTYELTVTTPTLSSAVEEAVGPNLAAGWLETFERRLEDAEAVVRDDVSLGSPTVTTGDGDVVVTMTIDDVDPVRGPAVCKALAEYVEGTYVEGVVPGYTYRPPVATLLADASNGGGDESNGGPLPL